MNNKYGTIAMKEKVVLAFSGGLDTSFCVKYLSEDKGFEVHTATVNTGGFADDDLRRIEEKALRLGAAGHAVLDITEEYYHKCIRYMVFGNVLRNNTYPVSVSSERVFQAMAIIRHAVATGAGYVAHGSTGAGNDQVRFDLTFGVLAPEIRILTPIRDLSLSRAEEIAYLRRHGVEEDFSGMAYSINQGLWGTSIGGKETLTSRHPLPEQAYPTRQVKTGSRQVELLFEKGELKGVDGRMAGSGPAAIRALAELAAPYAIGRDLHVGDTIIGIKGRVGFEAAAPLVIIKAHHLLEKHTLTKWQLYWKEQIGNWYGMFLHEAQYLDPVMRNMETFLESTQEKVSGTVFVRFHPYRFELDGIESPHDLMQSDFGKYGEENKAWSGEEVKGFTTIMGNAMKVFYSVNRE